jgi:predicted DNA-binding protein (MmcQ/YjbR family)
MFLLRSWTSSLLLGDFLYQLTRLVVVTLPGNIRLRDDSDEPAVLFDHGKTAHLVLGHDSQRFVQILLRIDRDNLLGSNFANRHLIGISPLCNDANCDIAVGQHPDQFVALDNRREADVLVPHHFRRVRNRFAGVDRAGIRGHDVFDALTHHSSLVIRIARCVPRAIPDQTVKIQHVSYGQRIRELALSFPETYEDRPWGHPVFKVGDNKMFASMSDGEASVSLTVKLTPEEREIALHMPYVDVARYVGRYGWVTAQVTDEESLENALEWLRESYWLKAPARLRSAVEET